MSLNTTNYSHKAINAAIKHYEAFVDNTSVQQRNFYQNFRLSIDLEKLHSQAFTFAYSFKDHSHMDFERKIYVPLNKVEKILYRTYIYSFTKSIYNSIFRLQVNDDVEKGYILEGHCKLYHLLRTQSGIYNKDNVVYNYNIRLGSIEQRRASFMKIILRFSFLSSFLKQTSDNFGTSAFFIPEFEGYLSRLKFRVDDLRGKEKKENKDTNVNTKYSFGLIQIVSLNNDNTCSNILNFENIPIFNAFENDKKDMLYYIPILENKPIVYNPSFFFNKANFIVLDKDNDIKYLSRAYQTENLSVKQNHFISSEVYTNSGIKPYSLYSLDKYNFELSDKTKKLFDVLNNIKDTELAKIIDSIIEKIKEEVFELEDIADNEGWILKILEPFLKS